MLLKKLYNIIPLKLENGNHYAFLNFLYLIGNSLIFRALVLLKILLFLNFAFE